MSNLYDILEVCLQEIDNGAAVEAVLDRYPDQAEELRPILEASVNARQMAFPAPSAEVMKRSRAKVLQRAAQLREEKAGKKAFVWLPVWRRTAVSFALIAVFLFSGTSLVRASSDALPGDSLYSVKRSWEDVVVLLTFDNAKRETLEIEHANERLKELDELFANGRTVEVDFAGTVMRDKGDGWWISNVLVIVSDQTDMPQEPIQVGAAVRVYGITQNDGIVLAEQIELLPQNAPLPEVEDELPEDEEVKPSATQKPNNSGSGSGSQTEAPESDESGTPSPEKTPKIGQFEGGLLSMDQAIWTVNGILVNISNAEIEGVPAIGALVKAEGYFGADGVFVAVKIEILSSGSDHNGNANGNSDDDNVNSNGGGGSNSNDDNGNSGGNTNGNDDNGGSGGGSGGGGSNDNGGGDDDNNNNG